MSSNCWSLGFILRGHFIKAVGNIVSSGIDCHWVSQGSARGVSALPDGRLTSWPLFLEPLHLQVSFGPFPSCVWCALSGWRCKCFYFRKHYWIPCWATAFTFLFGVPVAHTRALLLSTFCCLLLSPPFLPVLCPLSQTLHSPLQPLQLVLPDTRKTKPSVDTPATSQQWNHALSNFQCC